MVQSDFVQRSDLSDPLKLLVGIQLGQKNVLTSHRLQSVCPKVCAVRERASHIESASWCHTDTRTDIGPGSPGANRSLPLIVFRETIPPCQKQSDPKKGIREGKAVFESTIKSCVGQEVANQNTSIPSLRGKANKLHGRPPG